MMEHRLSEAFQKAHAKRPVDIVFGYVSGHVVGCETLAAMAASGAIMVNISMDDKANVPGRLEGGRYYSAPPIAAAVDLTLTTSPESVIKYQVHGGLALFCPLAANPDLYHPYDLPFRYDVSFVGGKHCWRPFFIRKLTQNGIHVTAFGPGWDNPPLVGEALARVYCQSRINLGFSAVGNSRNVRYLKTRDFEIPMSGGLLLTQNNPELATCYEIGKEIVVFEKEADCVEKIQWLLAHPDEAAKLRDAGRRRALRDHTWDRRLSDVFQLLGVLDPE